MTKKFVKLHIYQHEKESITIDSYEANSWDEFLFVRLPFREMNENSINQIGALFSDYAQRHNKNVVLIPDHIDIDLFGVEIEDEENE